MSSNFTKELRDVSISRPSSIKLPPLPAANYPYHYYQSDGNSGFLRAARAGNLEKVLEYLRSSVDINTSNANGLNALHLASKEGHVNIVQELLSRGANVNAATKKGNTALHIASLAGQEEVVKLLVKYNANINCQSQNGFSPLYMAAQENHIEVVKFLLANGANQSLATEDGFTPLAVSLQQGHDKVVAILLENDSKGSKVRLPALHIAAKKNDTKAAALLLQGDTQPDLNYKEGGFVNCTTKSGFTPLHIAAHYGNLEVAQLLIARGADVNYAASQNITPLHVASKWGKENLVKLLLEKSAQIDAKTKDGLTPLHCAARSGHDQVVDLLLESGAPFGAKTKNGLSALHMAAQGDHVDAARILLYYKSTLVDDVSSDYLSALHVASHCGNYNVAKLLCERRADVNAKALNGFSCLHIACKKNRLKLVELLISNDADIEGKTESGLTSLHVAAFVGSHDIVVYLLQHGANIDAVTIRGETPLHLATRNNQVDIVQTLLRFGATVDAKAKEAQTCLHLATRLGNIEIVNLLLKANAFVDNETKDGYSSLHIAAKEGHEEIASLLIDHGANLNLFTKRNFSALHICSKYGNIKVANLLLQKGATPDIQGKNDLTPLHCAVHYNHGNVALLLLQHGASPHVTARNGYTPLHIAAKKNALDIAEMLLEYNANTNAQSSGGFTPLHLSCQDGHSDMTYLLLANHADPNIASKCHLTPLHLCAQEDRVKCAEALVNKHADTNAQTLSGYTSLHVACHFGQINMVRYLLQLGANVNIETNLMFTPLHSAAQQGHVMIVKLLLEHGASPNKTNKHGMTALSIAQRLGYISVVEELKVVTETTIASKHELITEERYKIQAPEVSHEEHPLTDSEDETENVKVLSVSSAEGHLIDILYPEIGYYQLGTVIDNLKLPEKKTKGSRMVPYMLGDASSNVHMQYLREGVLMTEAEENKLHQTSFNKEEPEYPMLAGKDHWTESRDNLNDHQTSAIAPQTLVADNEVITKPRHGGERFQCRSFLVSFLVDARGGAMRGCRHSGVRVIIPQKRASMPTRITCRFVKRDKLTIPPPINEGEALAARVLEVGPVGCKFLGPVILEIPHFASLRNHEREIVVLRSDNGEKWTEHTSSIADDAVRDVFGDTVDSEDLQNSEELQSRRITRIITNDFPRFFALITRMRQEAQFIDEQGGQLASSIIPTIQAHIPEKALQKRIRVSLHVLPISAQLVQRSYGTRIHVSPVVTVEPRRRKFHKPITITIPLPNKSSSTRKQSHQHQHGNAYTSDSQTLRLLCSITGGTHAAQFDDITGHTPLTFSNDCATFTTTVSARFWLVDAQGVSDILKLAHEIYREATSVPYMSRFIVFAKRHDPNEALVRIFCITDDKENKTLEMQEHFTEIAKSKEVEVVNGNSIYIDLQSTNLQTIIKTNEQLTLIFRAFKENRLPCVVRLRDQEQEPSGRLIFSKDNGKLTSIQRTTSITMTNGQASALSSTTVIDPQTLQTICNLNILIPGYDKDLLENEERLRALHSVERDRNSESWKSDDMYRKGEIRLTDIARLLGSEWPALAAELELSEEEVTKIMDEFGENASLHMLRYWLKSRGTDATGNCLQQALRKIGKENIVHNCVFNIEWVTDAAEKEVAKNRLNSRGGSVDGITAGGRRLDEGFESDDEYERRRQGKSNLLIDDTNRSPTLTTIIKTITFEETSEDDLGGKKPNNETVTPQFKQLEPLKMVKRDLSKDFIPSSSSASSVDTIVTVAMRKSLGERDGPLHFVDSSKAATPVSRYGGVGHFSIYHPPNYSGSITPLSCHSHQFEMMHLETLKDKLNRLSRDKGSFRVYLLYDLLEIGAWNCFSDLDDPYHASSKQENADMTEGRTTPTANLVKAFRDITKFQSKKSSKKLGDFGIVNIVQEATPILPDDQPIISSIQSDTIFDQTKTTTQQLAEQTSHAFDDIPPTRVNPTPVGERFIKSRIIPDQARAIANAFKHAVVRPLKKTITKKKSPEGGGHPIEQQLTSSYQPYTHSCTNASPTTFNDYSDQQGIELSIDSCESISQTKLTPPPPTKPPRQNDESDSLSSVDMVPIPPAKPPRHFSLYSNKSFLQQTDKAVKKVLNLADTFGIVSNDDLDINILRQTPPDTSQFGNLHISDSLQTIRSFTVDPSRLATNTDTPVTTKSFDYESEQTVNINLISSPVDKTADEHVPIKITQFATELAEIILQETQENIKTSTNSTKTSSDNTSSFPHSVVTTYISPTPPSLARPLMFVSLETQPNVTPKIVSPLREVVTTKSTPLFTTSVTVVSSPPTLISSTTTVNNNDDKTNQPVTFVSNSNNISSQSKSNENTSQENCSDLKINTMRDNTVFFPQNIDNIASVHTLLSDYDNLHESYGSLHDDHQRLQSTSPPLPSFPSTTTTRSSTPSSSSSTLYESLDNVSTSTATSPTYVSAVSTFNTGGTVTPLQRLNSDTSDDDTIESLSQDNLDSTTLQSSIEHEATLAGKGEEALSSLLPPPPPPSSSSSSESSLLLNSSSILSSSFSPFSTSCITTHTSAKFSSKMPSKNSNIPFQQFNKIPSTIKSDTTASSSNSRRRLPLPTKLSFEQNITNMIEKESPLLQSELLTAEHELSVLRSRLAVNEGVTAITGTILESLKGQFDSHHKVDSTTSPFDISRINLLQQSSAIQTSPSNNKLPDSLEIHYDAESPKSRYIVVKAINSFWIVQPIADSQVQAHLQKFSSPVMKRATIQLPDSFDLDSDSDDHEKDGEQEKIRSHHSISDEDESVPIDRDEQLSEMKTIRSSSLLQHEDYFEYFDNKIEEIYLLIDQLKHKPLTLTILNNLQKKIHDLKFILNNIHLNKQDQLRIDYQLDELENQCTQTSTQNEYNFIDLFEQNLSSLQNLIEQIKATDTQSQRDLIADFEDKLELIKNIDEDTSSNEHKVSPQLFHKRLIPENPVITSDVFFEGDKTLKHRKTISSHPPRLIPEDAQINASSFYEGDITRSLYHHSESNKDNEHQSKKKPLIPEKPRVSNEVFYEGDIHHSLFTERPIENQTELNLSSPSVSIDNLRGIMSDLMLAASWSKKPTRLEKQQTREDEEEILAESFITTERRHSKSSHCEIIHEIEKLPSSHPTIFVDEQMNKSRHPTIIEEDELIVEKPLQQEEDLTEKKSPNEIAFIFVSPPSFEQEDEDADEDGSSISTKTNPPDTIDHTITYQSSEDDTYSSEYEARLRQTSNEVVGKILNDAISEAIEYEQEQLYYQTAVQLVQHAIENALIRYDNEFSPSEASTTSSENNDEENSGGYSSSDDDDDEENEKLIPQISDQPYLFVNDVVASKSAQELGDLVQELQTLEHQMYEIRPQSSSSSSSFSSLSENEPQNVCSLTSIPQIITTKSVNELTNLVVELQNMEEQLEDKLDEPMESIKSPISSKSFNELGGLINELNTVSKQLNNRIHEEIFISNNIVSLSEDIVKYRRDSLVTDRRSSSPIILPEVDENRVVQDIVNNVIKEAQDIMLKESNMKCIPTIVLDQRRVSCQRSTATSISDDISLSHEDNLTDRTFELAAQLDYLRRMSRYENTTYDPSTFISSSYTTMVNDEQISSDDDNHHQKGATKSGQQMDISLDSITQPSSDSLDYHSTENDINQIVAPRRTTSENSLHSTSSLHVYETHSLSTSCLIDKDDLTPSDNDQEPTTNNGGFLERVKYLVNKPMEIVQEAMENLGKQRPNESLVNVLEQQQHFQSAHDLHDEEKSKLVRSPELYNIGNVIKHDHRSLLTSSQIQYRTLSESALAIDDSKRHSLTTTSNDASVEFLTALSKENSMEFSQRLSTPFDDVLEKESSPEPSESHFLVTSTYSDAVEPTSSCQRPLAFRLPGQQNTIREEQYQTVVNDLVNQVLHDVVSELSGEQEDSSVGNTSDRLSISSNSSTSSDGEDNKLAGIDEEEGEEFTPNLPTRPPSPPPPPLPLPTKHFASISIFEIPPIIRRNSQSDTDVYFHAVSPSLDDYRQMQNSSSDEESCIRKRHEKYSGEGEDSSGGGGDGERTTSRRKRSTDQTNTHESLSLKFESNDNSKRRESLDSPPKDSTEKSLLKTLQEGILRTNLESLQVELKLNTAANYDYDAGSETDRDDSTSQGTHAMSKMNQTSMDMEAKNLLEDLIESINNDNLSTSISSEPISSQSDATTVIFNFNKTSLDDEEHFEQSPHQSKLNTKQFLSIHPSSSSSTSSSHSVIFQQQNPLTQTQTNVTSIVNIQSKKQCSTPSFSTTEFVGQCTKKKFTSYPDSLAVSHIPSSLSPSITSISDEYYSIPTTSTTLQSGN
ncbi:hypothetical protein I4U23_002824 [Adineta vaga]|nr:hypothetical protein I4U23_002824 [Adineta vaga]